MTDGDAESVRTQAAEELSRPHRGPDLVTVVVPCLNEADSISACLDSILQQDEQNLQIVVVDGGSSDGTREIVLAYSARDERVELVGNPSGSIPSSLNRGLAVARGRWLVRVDAHSTVPSDYVRRVVEHLRTGRWGGVGGRKDATARTETGRVVAAALSSRFGVGGSLYHYGTKMQMVDHIPFGAYPVALARELGGWDERVPANEDFEFDYRLRKHGYELLFDPRLAIAWRCRETIAELFSQYRRYGSGKAGVALLHPRSMRPRHVVPPALVAGWVGALTVAAASRRPSLLIAATLPYGLAVAAAAVSARNVHGTRARLLLLAAFPAMHLGWGIGFWEGLGKRIAGTRRASAETR